MKPKWLVTLLISAGLVVLLGNAGIDRIASLSPLNPFLPSETASSWDAKAAPPFTAKLAAAPAVELPVDLGYVNVKDLGAKGDGITDDTEALKQVFGRHKKDPGGAIRSIYLPNGTYLVSDTLAWGDKRKDVRGQSRDGVIIKLKDNCTGFQDPNKPKKVLQVEFGHGGQNFNQRLRNLTVDVGKGNPGAIGIGFHTNNSGGVYDVVIRSSDFGKRGHTGLSLDKPWPGPGLIKNVHVDGFDTGIFISHDQYSMTFDHLLLSNQRQVGFVNSWNSVAIHDLKSLNRVPAVENRGKMGLMALIDADLTGGDRKAPAIINHKEGVLFARNVKTQGYGTAIDNQSGHTQKIQAPAVDEFVSHDITRLFPGPQTSLRLPIEDPPPIPYGDPKNWVSVTKFGAKPDDKQDDGAAIQQAIDSGAETVYFPVGVYRSQQSIRVRGNVRRLLGPSAGVVFDTPNRPAFVIEDGKSKAVAVEIESPLASRHRYWVEHASQRTLVLSGGSYINTVPGGKVFIEDTTAVPLVFDRQKVWMRQINTESYDHNPHIINKGSDLWILGLKTEKDRTIIGTYQGGRTEVLGGLLYKNKERIGPAPAFISEDAAVSLVYRNKGLPYEVQVSEKHNGETKELSARKLSASNGRVSLFVSSR
jgi:hypothetical protein